jgi:Mg-chelatase subunit ChlD
MILDRSGSMESIREDVVGGFNAFLREQKALPGLATLSLVQFDTQDPYEVLHSFKLIAAVPDLTHDTYVPRGGTPLLDAMGRGINDLEQSLAQMKEADRPSKVVVVFVTDGQENSSREFRRDQVMSMITEKQELHNWQFVYLSADINAVEDAVQHYGVRATHAMAFDKNALGSAAAFHSVSSNMRRYRDHVAQDLSFSDEDRSVQQSDKKRRK